MKKAAASIRSSQRRSEAATGQWKSGSREGRLPGRRQVQLIYIMVIILKVKPTRVPSKLPRLSYQSVLDDMRRTVATEFLQNTHLLIDQVAERVGFSDATRAHRIAFIHQAQRPKLGPYGKVALERCVAGRGAKLAFNELRAISFTMRGRGERTAT